MQKPPEVAASAVTVAHHRAHLPRDFLELTEGFNLFYDPGSKRRVLNDIALCHPQYPLRRCARPRPQRLPALFLGSR